MYKQYQFPRLLEREPGPDWPAGLAAQHIVLSYFRDALGWRDAIASENSWEAVHQLRVNVRRTRTALNAFAAFWGENHVREHRRRLSRLARAFSPTRDLDVLETYLGQTEIERRELADQTELVRRLVRDSRAAQQPALARELEQLEVDGYPAELIDYFSRTPFDMWQGVAAND